jgi:hypothetical protein
VIGSTSGRRRAAAVLSVRQLIEYGSIRKSRDKALTCFVVALAGRGGQPEAAVEILSGDLIVAQAPVPLPAPDASGRIEHVVQVPVHTLSPGRYSVRLTVGQGPRREAREAAFELVD